MSARSAALRTAGWLALGVGAAVLGLAWDRMPAMASVSWGLPLPSFARLVGLAEPLLVALVVALLLGTLLATTIAASSSGPSVARWASIAALSLGLECVVVVGRVLRDASRWSADGFSSRELYEHAFAGGLLWFQAIATLALASIALLAAPRLWRRAGALPAQRLLASCTLSAAAFTLPLLGASAVLGLAALGAILGGLAEGRAARGVFAPRPIA